MTKMFALAWAIVVFAPAHADVSRRFADVMDREPIEEYALIGSDARLYRPPPSHSSGAFHLDVYRREGRPTTFLKIMEAHSKFERNVTSMLLAEPVGGPRIHRAGVSIDGAARNHFVEMEFLFDDDPTTFSFKGTEAAGVVPIARDEFKARLDDFVEMVGRTVDARLQIKDIDFIMSREGVRWIDTDEWVSVPTMDDSSVDEVSDVLWWAENVHRGFGLSTFQKLLRRIDRSEILGQFERRAVIDRLERDWPNCQSRLMAR